MAEADNSWDDLCLPDDVLAALDVPNLGGAPHKVLEPPTARHPCGASAFAAWMSAAAPPVLTCSADMFQKMLPAGPLHSAPQPAASFAAPCAGPAGYARAEDDEKLRLQGQVHVLKARLQDAERQKTCAERTAAGLQAELRSAKAESQTAEQDENRKLRSRLSFMKQELENETQKRSALKAQLEDIQASFIQGAAGTGVSGCRSAVGSGARDRVPSSAFRSAAPLAAKPPSTGDKQQPAEPEPEQLSQGGAPPLLLPPQTRHNRPLAAGATAAPHLALAPVGPEATNSPLFQQRGAPFISASARKRSLSGDDVASLYPPEQPGTRLLTTAGASPTRPAAAACDRAQDTTSLQLPSAAAQAQGSSAAHQTGEDSFRAAVADQTRSAGPACQPPPASAEVDTDASTPPAGRHGFEDQRTAANAVEPPPIGPPQRMADQQHIMPDSVHGGRCTGLGSASSSSMEACARANRLLSVLLSHAGALQRMLVSPRDEQLDRVHDEQLRRDEPHAHAELMHAIRLVLGGSEYSPPLLRAICAQLEDESCMLALQPPGLASRRAAALQLATVLVEESEHCRDAILCGGKDAPVRLDAAVEARPAAGSPTAVPEVGSRLRVADCSRVLPVLLDVTEHLSLSHEAQAEVVHALSALETLFWEGHAAELPRLCDWIDGGSRHMAAHNAGAGCVFSRLLHPAMSVQCKLLSTLLLKRVLVHRQVFEAFVSPGCSQHPTRATPIQLLASLLSVVRHNGFAGGSALLPRKHLGSGKPNRFAVDDGLLALEALRVFSAVVVQHERGAQQLLLPALSLALIARLVALLQTQVHRVLQCRFDVRQGHSLDLIKESLLLLLELARSTDIHAELAGSSWSGDLLSVTGRLVRNELHPELEQLGLAAKLLQNAALRAPGHDVHAEAA